MTLGSVLLRLLGTAASLAALAVLWRYRPEWPDLPGSLSTPVTTTLLQQFAVIAAWMFAALLVLLVLARNFRRAQARRLLDPSGASVSAVARGFTGSPRTRPLAFRPSGVEARLVIVAPREPPPNPPSEEIAPITPDTKLADRPLISLLGPLTIHGAKRSRRGLRARALELIAFLVLRRDGAQRDEILEALWPGEDPKRSRHRLYQAVRDARRLLGNGVASERDRYWLDRDRISVDVDQLDELLEQANRADCDERSKEFRRRALSLFRAAPLAGSDYVWSEGEVRTLRATYVELLKLVGRAQLETGDAQESLEAAERGLVVDVLDEDLWRLALEAEGALGLREAIEERYERLRDLLQERLALEPAKETRALYLRLLGQN